MSGLKRSVEDQESCLADIGGIQIQLCTGQTIPVVQVPAFEQQGDPKRTKLNLSSAQDLGNLQQLACIGVGEALSMFFAGKQQGG
jgi:hypothetical protein